MKEDSAVTSFGATRKPAEYRLGFMCLMAAIIGGCTGVIAFLLYSLIGLCTNLAFYYVWSFHFRSPLANHLGIWVIGVPVIGGLIVGVMAKYGSQKIKGHGIPEAMEAVLTSRSRIEAKVAILKPLSSLCRNSGLVLLFGRVIGAQFFLLALISLRCGVGGNDQTLRRKR